MLTSEILTIIIHTGEIPTRYDTYQGDVYWEVHGNRIPTSRVLPMGYLPVGYIPVRDLDQ